MQAFSSWGKGWMCRFLLHTFFNVTDTSRNTMCCSSIEHVKSVILQVSKKSMMIMDLDNTGKNLSEKIN